MAVSLQSFAQSTVNLWPEGTPGDNGSDNVAEITLYTPETTTTSGKAVVICPGGGYAKLSMDHEGRQIASWLARHGTTAAVLKYRLPHGHSGIPEADAREAMRYLRRHADELGILTGKIGIMGSSAGGHLAATVATLHADTQSRPDFSILLYPVISFNDAITHRGTRNNLLGNDQSQQLIAHYSLDLQVDSLTPPALLLLSDDDKSVNPLNSVLYYQALKSNGTASSIHIFPEGGHGWGFHDTFAYLPAVKELILDWINRQ